MNSTKAIELIESGQVQMEMRRDGHRYLVGTIFRKGARKLSSVTASSVMKKMRLTYIKQEDGTYKCLPI